MLYSAQRKLLNSFLSEVYTEQDSTAFTYIQPASSFLRLFIPLFTLS